jgi:hypothetical protein
MEQITRPPKWFVDLAPPGWSDGLWWGVLGFGALFVLLLLFAFCSKVLGLFKGKPPKDKDPELEMDLQSFPPLPPSTGDRRLLVDGVPVRMRLVVIAPAGTESKVQADKVPQILDRVVTGMGDVAQHDKPETKIWPLQRSYEGFANQFHRNTPLPEGEDEPSRWVMVAGRVKLGQYQIMLGLGLQAIKPTTVGRRTLDAHQWADLLRVRVRD